MSDGEEDDEDAPKIVFTQNKEKNDIKIVGTLRWFSPFRLLIS